MIPVVVSRCRLKLRARLTLSYAGLVIGSGLVMIGLVYLYLRLNPKQLELRLPQPAGDSGAEAVLELQSGVLLEFLDALLIISLVVLGILGLVSGLVGWLLAGRILVPLKAMSAAASRAAAGDLKHPLALQGPRDEVQELADTFDRMLASLANSLDTHRRFAANASHELRTPLATTQTMIDVALADPDATAKELRELAIRIRETNSANAETIDALLDLAHAQSGNLIREPVDLATLTGQVLADQAVRTTGWQIESELTQAEVTGDPVLLRQLLSNLIRNALVHGSAARPIRVLVCRIDGAAMLRVSNHGEVIAPDQVAMLCEPFVRGHGRTVTRGRGHGLGLAIVAAIVTAHAGELDLVANPEGGLTVTVTLPVTG